MNTASTTLERSTSRVSKRAWAVAAFALLGALAAGGYAGAHHELMFFDSLQITQDLTLTSISATWQRLVKSDLVPTEALCDLTFAFNHAYNIRRGLPGFHAASFYTVNIVIHVLTVWLVYVLATRLLAIEAGESRSTKLPALLGAAWFAVHPLHVDSVSYIVQRHSLLATMFYALCLIFYLRTRETTRLIHYIVWMSLSLITGFLASKSKAMAMTFPVAILVLEFCLRASNTAALKKFALWATPTLLLFGGVVIWFLVGSGTLNTQTWTLRGMNTPGLWGVKQHVLSESVALLHYWKLLLLPLPSFLSVDHPLPPSEGLFDGLTFPSLLLHGLLIGLALRAAFRGARTIAFGILFFYVALLPYVFVPQVELLVEYKTYLCAVGVACGVADLLRRLLQRYRPLAPVSITAIAILAMYVTTWQRSKLFENPVALWQDETRKYPDHLRGYLNLGTAQFGAGQFEAAIESFQAAVRLDPTNAQLHFFIGNALRELGRLAEAAEAFRLTSQANPGNLSAYVNQADALSQLGRLDEAVAALRNGLALAEPKIDPLTRAKAYLNLGNALARNRRIDEAESAYRSAIEVAPLYPNGHYALGFVMEVRGRLKEAAELYNAALGLNPNHAEAAAALQRVQPRTK